MLDIKPYGNFEPVGKSDKKRQIILCHSSREADEYLASLKFRYNEKYDKIPNFFVTRKGKILKLLEENTYSNFITNEKLKKTTVVIVLENLGWLNKKPLSDYYINWKGSIYKGKVHEKKWRDYFFWEPYTDEQVKTTAQLCSQINQSLRIENKCIGHNTKFEGVEKYEGVVSRSNYDTWYTDLNPSFDFELFTKYFENEQFAQ